MSADMPREASVVRSNCAACPCEHLNAAMATSLCVSWGSAPQTPPPSNLGTARELTGARHGLSPRALPRTRRGRARSVSSSASGLDWLSSATIRPILHESVRVPRRVLDVHRHCLVHVCRLGSARRSSSSSSSSSPLSVCFWFWGLYTKILPPPLNNP
jgi:hypothetical protein